MKNFIHRHITGRPFWVNLLWAIGLLVVIVLLFVLSLNWMTNHGVARTVPSVIGKPLPEVEKLLEDKGFEVVIQDSVFYDSLPPLAVVKQVPEADAVVKVNRTVYVTINRVIPPDVDMPNLKGYNLRNAEMLMKNLGLLLGDTTSRPDFAKNTVLDQLVNGAPIAPGTKIKVGSRIDLVVGSGVGAESLAVPNLVGLTYEQAVAMIESQGLILGAVVAPGIENKNSAYVVRQTPEVMDSKGRTFRIRPGQMMDLYLDVNPPAPSVPAPADTTAPAPSAPADGGDQ
ncbi:PASTA domain-containing protein [Flaviaesturariibacter amylovorans]|uniref:PASTA domain-containing protein n=1 Tax=Flaviaesturariibacter amylovorans TaxID=1084520 RepID=A0ABP8GHX2_9BACT